MNDTILNFHLETLGIFYVVTFGQLVHPGPHTVSPVHAYMVHFLRNIIDVSQIAVLVRFVVYLCSIFIVRALISTKGYCVLLFRTYQK